MNDQAELPIDAAIRLARLIDKSYVAITDGTRSVLQEWDSLDGSDFAERPDFENASRETSSRLIDAVIHDCKNMEIVCEQLAELKGLLVIDGNPTELAEELAIHSEGANRVVGRYKLMPYKSSFADMVGKIDAFVFAVGNEASRAFRSSDADHLRFKRPEFWRALREHIENRESPSVDKAAMAVAWAMDIKLPEDFAADAVMELATYRKTLVCNESHAVSGKTAFEPSTGSLVRIAKNVRPGIVVVKASNGDASSGSDSAVTGGKVAGNTNSIDKADALAELRKIAFTLDHELNDGAISERQRHSMIGVKMRAENMDLLLAWDPEKASEGAYPSRDTVKAWINKHGDTNS
tara:strand:- start:3975 stop:5024 length:1050 start_codon:yes stop_codon:yes gene_type:complete